MGGKLSVFVLAYILLIPSPASPNSLFEAGLTYQVGGNPRSVVFGDFDNDGDADLATANAASNTVSILINAGNGTYAPKVDYPTGVGPSSIFVADLDGDGYLDLAVANLGSVYVHDSSTVSVLKNNGDGTFAPKVDYLCGLSSTGVFSSDLDRDGDQDLAVANSGYYYDYDYSDYEDSTVSILLNNGDGTFADKIDYLTGKGSGSLFIADFNGDGDLDLACVNVAANTLSLLENSGNGTFAQKVDYAIGEPSSVFASDVDGDGDFDLLVSSGEGLFFFKNLGGGNFSAEVDYSVVGAPAILGSDLDADGDTDLAAINGVSAVSILTNSGDGSFAPRRLYGYGTGPFPSSLCATDLDEDGDPDLAVANSENATVSILKNNGNGDLFPSRFEYRVKGWPLLSMVLTDFDLDGDFDLAISYADSSLLVYQNNGEGIFDFPAKYQTGYIPNSVVASDFDGDADVDLVVANSGYDNQPGNTISILKNNGDGTFLPRIDYPAMQTPTSVFATDLDRDGDFDLAVAGYGGIATLSNNGDGTFAAPVVYYLWETVFPDIFIAKLDGDEDPDLLFPNWAINDETFSILKNKGDGTFGPRVDYLTGRQPLRVYAFDLNRDGYNDVITVNDWGGTISVLRNNGDGTLAPRVDYPVGFFGSFNHVVSSDFDGDENLDIIVSAHYHCNVSFFKNLGWGTFTDKVEFMPGPYPEQLSAADLDRDADIDLVVGNLTGFSVLKNLSSPINCGQKGDLNADAVLTATDVVLMLNCVFLQSGNCATCFADANCDGGITPADTVLELLAVFVNQPFPC